jgi:hypothetical protein
MNGNRLPDHSSIDVLMDAEPGTYLVTSARKSVWAKMPNKAIRRIPVNGGSEGDSQSWDMVEHGDDTITLSPSINLHPTPGVHDGWHGFLERGVWRQV